MIPYIFHERGFPEFIAGKTELPDFFIQPFPRIRHSHNSVVHGQYHLSDAVHIPSGAVPVKKIVEFRASLLKSSLEKLVHGIFP